jgi:hypothetical protein
MARSRTDIAEEIVANLRSLKQPGINVRPKVEECIVQRARIRPLIRQVMLGRVIARRAEKAREALARLRDELGSLPLHFPKRRSRPSWPSCDRSIDAVLGRARVSLRVDVPIRVASPMTGFHCLQRHRRLRDGIGGLLFIVNNQDDDSRRDECR